MVFFSLSLDKIVLNVEHISLQSCKLYKIGIKIIIGQHVFWNHILVRQCLQRAVVCVISKSPVLTTCTLHEQTIF